MLPLHSFLDELEKIAKTRAVKEWQAATAAGQHGVADQIAAGSAQAGLKPRYIQDVSIGGAEAGVDKMMGHAGGGVGAAPNESGYIARKLYKPDSAVTQAEFTPKLLAEKQQYTDAARALSPEAKAMVPAMYGHQTMGAGTELQRTVSHHEFVPGLSGLKGSGGTGALEQHVLNPMHNDGMTMADTVSSKGTNWGNVVNSPQGPKVLDFLPQKPGQLRNTHTEQSLTKYLPGEVSQFSAEGGKDLGALRKEVFNPSMRSTPASPMVQADTRSALRHIDAKTLAGGTQARFGGDAAGSAVSQLSSHTLPTPQGVLHNAAGVAAHTPVAAGTLNRAGQVAGKLEHSVGTVIPGALRRAGSALSHVHM